MLRAIKDINFAKKFSELFSTVLFDCSGVVWRSGKLLPGANEIFSILQQKGIRFYLVTNSSAHSRQSFLTHCAEIGLVGIKEKNVACTAHLAASYLKNTLKFTDKVFLIGNRGMITELDAAGIKHTSIGPDIAARHGTRMDWLNLWLAEYNASNPPIGCVLVGFDEHMNFASVLRAAVCLQADPKCHFIATNPDPTYPVNTIYKERRLEIPGTGTIARAISTAAGREPLFLGKPHAPMFEHVKQLYLNDAGSPLDASRTLFIGDRVETDVCFARRFGMHSLLLTGTGVTGQLAAAREAHAALERAPKSTSATKALHALIPDYHCESLAELVSTLRGD